MVPQPKSCRTSLPRSLRLLCLRILAQRSQNLFWSQSAQSGSTELIHRARCKNNGAITVMSSSMSLLTAICSILEKRSHASRQCSGSPSARDTVQYLIHLNTCFHPTVVMATNSPVFNPLDYEVWGMLPRQFYHTRSNSIDHLKQLLVEERHCFDHRIIERTVRQWRVRLRACLCS